MSAANDDAIHNLRNLDHMSISAMQLIQKESRKPKWASKLLSVFSRAKISQSSGTIEAMRLSMAEQLQEVPEQQTEEPLEAPELPVTSSVDPNSIQIRLMYGHLIIPPIHKLPAELLAEIFHWITQGSPPGRRLAGVCKRWKEILLQTPLLWTEIRVHFYTGEKPNELIRLQRRIELSQSTLLDVTMDTSGRWPPDATQGGRELFEMVLDSDTERWRRLSLFCWGDRYSRYGLLTTLIGRSFSTLRSLVVHCQGDTHHSLAVIGQLLLQSKPRIEELETGGDLPSVFLDPQMFKYVKYLRVPTRVAGKLRGLRSLQELDAWGLADPDPISFPPLPSRVKFTILKGNYLAFLQTTHLQYLEVKEWIPYREDTLIELRNLISLTFRDGSLLNVRNISAPNLQILKIMGKSGRSKSKQAMEITDLFTTTPSALFVRPTDLTLWTTMPVEVLVLVLRSWPQIQHLAFIFDYQLVEHEFFHIFLRPEPLCLDLIALRLDAKAKNFIKNRDKLEWIARGIIQLRQKLPLELVAWRESRKSNSWYEIRR